jgi:MFS family permease
VGLLALFALFCHFNRVSMAVAGTEHIIGTRNIDETAMGTVYSAYLLVYTIFMTPGGWLIDRIGPRKALLLMSFGSALFVASTGLVGLAARTGFALVGGLLVIRGLLGFVTVPMHPGAARMVALWTPPYERSKANGSVNCAALIGIAIAPPLFGGMSDRIGWPAAFLVSGVVSALPATAWALYSRDGPRAHPSVNFEERELIERDRAPLKEDAAGGASGILGLFRNRSLVFLTLSYAADNYFQYLFVYWIQYYFDHTLNLGKELSREYTTVTMLAMAVGMAAGGWFTDRIQGRLGLRRGLAFVSMASLILSAGFLGLGLMGHQIRFVVACFAASMGVLGICEAAFWTTATHLGESRGGSAAAIMNTGGNGGGLLAPVITPLFARHFGWKSGLGLACAVSVLGALCWLWIDPKERSNRPERL